MTLSLNVVTYNEEGRILDCLTRASAYCDELVVVDSSSTDGTVDIAREFGALVVVEAFRPTCEMLRPTAEHLSTTTHVLVLDADEYIEETFGVAHLKSLDEDRFDGAWLNRDGYVDGNLCYTPDPQFRWYKKGTARHAPRAHTFIRPTNPARVLKDSPVGTIQHWKSQTEMDIDAQRCARLEASGEGWRR